MHNTVDELTGIVDLLRSGGALDEPLFKRLLAVVESAVKSNAAFYYRSRSHEQYKDIVMQSLENFYRRLQSGNEPIHNPQAYLHTIITNVLHEEDTTFYNKQYLSFKKMLYGELQKAAAKGEVVLQDGKVCGNDGKALSGKPVMEVPDLILIVAAAEMNGIYFSVNYTAGYKRKLLEAVVSLINDDSRAIDINSLLDQIALQMEIIPQYPVAEGKKEFTHLQSLQSPSVKPDTDFQIKEIIHVFLRRIEADFLTLKKRKLYAALWEYQLSGNNTLTGLADQFGFSSPNNIMYYLRKFRIREIYAEYLVSVSDIDSAASYHHIQRYAALLFEKKVSDLLGITLGEKS